MSSPKPLDLSELDPAIWYVQVSDEHYGPYTLGQMQSFIYEGRITSTSRIAQDDPALFRDARDITAIAALLPEETLDQSASSGAEPAISTNFVVIARGPDGEMRDTRRTLSQALNSFGRFAETLPGVFILRSPHRLAEVRSSLSQNCTDRTQILIVETDDGRLGWLGMADETDQHIRTVWNAKID